MPSHARCCCFFFHIGSHLNHPHKTYATFSGAHLLFYRGTAFLPPSDEFVVLCRSLPLMCEMNNPTMTLRGHPAFFTPPLPPSAFRDRFNLQTNVLAHLLLSPVHFVSVLMNKGAVLTRGTRPALSSLHFIVCVQPLALRLTRTSHPHNETSSPSSAKPFHASSLF
jgi:hypothetical protein